MRLRTLFLLALVVVAGACREQYDAGRDASLKQALTSTRGAIARFRHDQRRYPQKLDELVPKYLPTIPVDPFTGSSTTWKLTTEETVSPSADFQTGTVTAAPSVIIDLHSSAPGADQSGVLYSNY